MSFQKRSLHLAAALGWSALAHAADQPPADELVIVVPTPRVEAPLTVKTNPKTARQPVPAHDGADYLKTIPGFSVIRKGGTDGDPVLRGMAGSRLNILLNGESILGGCGGRMDPPTAYVFPAAYDQISVLKGPQTVLYGPGNSAGTVMFERNTMRRGDGASPRLSGSGALTVGSFGRNDEVAEARIANESGYAQVDGTRTEAGDYKDGAGNAVRSSYMRWSGNAALGWTPDDDTALELSLARSDGYAAYADRAADGTKFARSNYGLRFNKRNVSPLIEKIEGQLFYNYIDHVMDNYTLRPQGATALAMNPDHLMTGGRIAATLTLSEATGVTAGLDARHDVHAGRNSDTGLTSGAAATASYLSKPRAEDMRFDQIGLFGEITQMMGEAGKVVAGARADLYTVKDSRACVGGMQMNNGACMTVANDTRGISQSRTLGSGFARFVGDLESGNYYVGVGHVERNPDYWERQGRDPVTGSSLFLSLRPEKTNQLDVGASWEFGGWSGSVSAFYGRITDYLLAKWMTPNLTPVLPYGSYQRNVNATTLGGEAGVGYRLSETWKANATLSYVKSDNITDNKPLAQQPPPEARLSANYDDKTWSVGMLWRLVAPQNRYDVGSGNIVMNGMDLGPTGGFGVFSLNGGWRPSKKTQLTTGVDNLFNKKYAEAMSRGFSGAVPGYLMPVNVRINEPGRTLWVKANFAFD